MLPIIQAEAQHVLIVAVRNNHIEIVKLLIAEVGIDLLTDYKQVINQAAFYDHTQIFKLLIADPRANLSAFKDIPEIAARTGNVGLINNSRRIVREILKQNNIIPVINENDSIAIEKLMFTDNDELAGLIASLIDADKLIILTTVNGVYDGDPSDATSKIIPVINAGDKWQKVSVTKSEQGRGGMISKLSTARKMSQLGIMTHIAHINENEVLLRLGSYHFKI